MAELVLGMDVSTSVTGICVLDPAIDFADKQKYVRFLDRIEFKDCKTMWDKADRVALVLQKLRDEIVTFDGYRYDPSVKITKIVVEEALMGFRPGLSSATTIAALLRFNGICSYLARSCFSVEPEYIMASHARKACGVKMQKSSVCGMNQKQQVFDYMSKNDLSHVVWPKKKNGSTVDWAYDATDAYVIARAACLLNNSKH